MTFVYFIDATWQTDGPVKIGVTKDIAQRYASMQAYCPAQLRLIGAVRADYKDEALIHKAFCRQHMGNEWFERSPRLNEVIAQIVEHGFEAVRPVLDELAKDGFGIRVKSEEGKEAIRRSTRKPIQSDTESRVRDFMRANRSKAKQAEPTS